LSVVLVASTFFASAASAQQWWREPTFGATTLNGGFSLWTQYLTAGGGSNPQNVWELNLFDSVEGTRCVGFVTRSPDYRFVYTGGRNLLRFYVETHNNADAMLLVNAPDTSWRCNDDSHSSLMPTVDFNNPQPGQYDVWVGTYDGSSRNPATFYATEVAANFPGSGVPHATDSSGSQQQQQPPAQTGGICTNTCPTSHDSECDDGGPGSLYSICEYGSDCADCGVRQPQGSGGGGMICNNSCPTANDSECDDGGPGSLYSICAYGSDCNDCGPRPAR
jgi:hypothetical protein